MSRDAGRTGSDREPDGGRLRPLGPAPVTVAAVLGLVAGWLLRPLAERTGGTAPLVTTTQVVALLLVAAILAATAWLTRRVVSERRPDLEAGRAVNRLLVARASALVGALVAGGYAGYAVSWLGHGAELAGERFWGSAAAAVGGLCMLGAALLLEQACRVDPPEDLER